MILTWVIEQTLQLLFICNQGEQQCLKVFFKGNLLILQIPHAFLIFALDLPPALQHFCAFSVVFQARDHQWYRRKHKARYLLRRVSIDQSSMLNGPLSKAMIAQCVPGQALGDDLIPQEGVPFRESLGYRTYNSAHIAQNSALNHNQRFFPKTG